MVRYSLIDLLTANIEYGGKIRPFVGTGYIYVLHMPTVPTNINENTFEVPIKSRIVGNFLSANYGDNGKN